MQKENKEEKIKKDKDMEESEESKAKKETPMGKLMSNTVNPPIVDDIVEGSVIAIEKGAVYVDLHPWGTGIIFGREYINARDLIKKINPGDKIAGKIVGRDNKEGYIEISLKEARQALIWSEAEDAIRDKRVYELTITEANKGGLMLNWQGVTGFLPASQLKTEHYPRINDGDKDKILDELKKLVGEKISVSIITAIPKENKLIFSEKDPRRRSRRRSDRYRRLRSVRQT
jgi:small subunit ribosomal protein S1